MAHVRQSRPDSGLGSGKSHHDFCVVPSLLGGGLPQWPVTSKNTNHRRVSPRKPSRGLTKRDATKHDPSFERTEVWSWINASANFEGGALVNRR